MSITFYTPESRHLDLATYADIHANDLCRDPVFQDYLADFLKDQNVEKLKTNLAICIEHSQCRILFEDEVNPPLPIKKLKLPLLKRIKLALWVLFHKNSR
jgi:hypothetical protein